MPGMAVVGDQESTLPFRALGFETRSPGSREEARRMLEELFGQGGRFGVICVTETLAQQLGDYLEQLREGVVTPALLVIPGAGGSRGIGWERLREMVRKAVGADSLK